jgi:SET domain-containing protein
MNEYINIRYISKGKGKGAFAKKDIKKDTIIDVANVILIPNKEYKKIKETVLYDYCYIWQDPRHKPEFENAITLSISQFINHSYEPNVKYLYDYEIKAIEFSAIRDIKKGEELTVNYNGLVNDKSSVWFNVLD